jgi:hypothetical protein
MTQARFDQPRLRSSTVGRPRTPDALTAAQITKAYEERHDLVGMRVPRDVRDQIAAACKLRAVYLLAEASPLAGGEGRTGRQAQH